jgi:hypothetical protein
MEARRITTTRLFSNPEIPFKAPTCARIAAGSSAGGAGGGVGG